MRILVTGGAGYVGSHAARWLSQCGHEIWVYDDLAQGHEQAVPAGQLIRGRLHDQATLTQALCSHDIEAVMHFAALCLVGDSVREPFRYWDNNVVGTTTLLDCMQQCGVGQLVFSSTCATYGVPDEVPISEQQRQKPVNPYGSTKLACELLMRDASACFGLAAVALRYFNAAGASESGEIGEDHTPETHLIPLVMQTALGQRAAIDVLGTDYPTPDGTCLRDYVHVDDLAEAHRLALEHFTPSTFEAYNVGTGMGHSVLELIEGASRVTGCRIPVVHKPRRPGDPPILVAAPDKIQRELGWRPRYRTLESILESAWRWHRSHPQGYDAR